MAMFLLSHQVTHTLPHHLQYQQITNKHTTTISYWHFFIIFMLYVFPSLSHSHTFAFTPILFLIPFPFFPFPYVPSLRHTHTFHPSLGFISPRGSCNPWVPHQVSSPGKFPHLRLIYLAAAQVSPATREVLPACSCTCRHHASVTWGGGWEGGVQDTGIGKGEKGRGRGSWWVKGTEKEEMEGEGEETEPGSKEGITKGRRGRGKWSQAESERKEKKKESESIHREWKKKGKAKEVKTRS